MSVNIKLSIFSMLSMVACVSADPQAIEQSSVEAAPLIADTSHSPDHEINTSTARYIKDSKFVDNWRAQAVANLVDSEGSPLTMSEIDGRNLLRCIKLNNYWCLKDVGWLGGVGSDSDNHTAFRGGEWAARAAVRNFRTAYFTHGRKSALQIIKAYAPSTDCVGSRAAQRADGSCVGGYNRPEEYARMLVKGTPFGIRDDLRLFDDQGNATENLLSFLRNVSGFEMGGVFASDDVIRKGISMEAMVQQ